MSERRPTREASAASSEGGDAGSERGGRRLFREGLEEGTGEVGEEQAAAFVAAGALPPRERLPGRIQSSSTDFDVPRIR